MCSAVKQSHTARKATNIDAQIGNRVRLRRVMLGYTQAELAEFCGLSPQQIHKYESGMSRMTSTRLMQFADALKVPVGWFFGEQEDAGQLPDDIIAMMADLENIEGLIALNDIRDPAAKSSLVKTLKMFAYGDAQQIQPTVRSHGTVDTDTAANSNATMPATTR